MSEFCLILVRHAKTEREGPPKEGDHGRRLMERGVSDAHAAGRWIIETGLQPDLVMCSSATRAHQTWQAMAEADAGDEGSALASVEVWREPRVYNATAAELLGLLSEVADDVGSLAIVGHAPGIPDLAADLTDWEEAEPEAAAALEDGYPTMTCAVLRSSVPAGRVCTGSMVLSMVHTGRGKR